MSVKKYLFFYIDFCSGCFKCALRNQNDYSIMNEEFNQTAEQLFGYEQVAKRIANIRLTPKITGEMVLLVEQCNGNRHLAFMSK